MIFGKGEYEVFFRNDLDSQIQWFRQIYYRVNLRVSKKCFFCQGFRRGSERNVNDLFLVH